MNWLENLQRSFLDFQSMRVLDLMADLARQGMTMVVVTHEMGFARRVADQVVFMDEGRVVEAGPPEAIFTAPKSARLQSFLAEVL